MPSSPNNNTKRNVLLIEEYDALSVAIASALTKFAPQHRFHAVPSFEEARPFALEEKPELIILDFDPPLPGAIAFFGEMKRSLPETRVLALVAGVPPDLNAERGAIAALQFLQKPFELVEFGAAVQALLGPWRQTGRLRGTLRDLALDDVIVLALSNPRNTVIEVYAGEHYTGELHLRNNQLIHARAGDADGKCAIVEMLAWPDPHFIENPDSELVPRTIHSPWTNTLIEALREARKFKATAPAPTDSHSPVQPVAAPAKIGPKILIIDDTEMLLIFVEDSLALADPTFQITATRSGLNGVKEAARIVPNLVVVDYVLPDIKGDEVCRRIGKNQETAHLPIIMMSGHVHEMAEVASTLPNVVATIAKPFRSETLVALVQQTLKQGPLKKKPTFPSKKEIAPASVADFTSSKTPSLTQREQKSAEPLLASEVLPLIGDGTPARRVAQLRSNAGPEKPKPRAHELAPPQGPRIPTQGLKETAPLQASQMIQAHLASNQVVLELPLDVIAMQVNSAFQIGAIRARPASLTVAIEVPANGMVALPLSTGFQLGRIDLDATGNISIVRLVPTSQPFRVAEMHSAFEINGVTVVPANERERVQLMSTASSMTMQLFARLELISVELGRGLEITQLVLCCRDKTVRVSLNARGLPVQTGADFETSRVQLDQSGRIDELTLTPIGP